MHRISKNVVAYYIACYIYICVCLVHECNNIFNNFKIKIFNYFTLF